MVFVIVWFLDHFTLEYVPSVEGIELSLIFLKLYILTSNNVI